MEIVEGEIDKLLAIFRCDNFAWYFKRNISFSFLIEIGSVGIAFSFNFEQKESMQI